MYVFTYVRTYFNLRAHINLRASFSTLTRQYIQGKLWIYKCAAELMAKKASKPAVARQRALAPPLQKFTSRLRKLAARKFTRHTTRVTRVSRL